MKILLNIMKFDYGDKKRGFSFEYDSFYDLLKKMGHTVEIFDFLTISQTYGKEKMNEKLLNLVKKNKHDLIFTSLYVDEFSSDFLQKMKEVCKESVVWMNDDQWRWESLGKKLCFSFHHVVTTDPDAIKKYEKIGYKNAILSQFACNTHVFKKLNLSRDIDVSFIGQPNPWRRFIVNYLKKNGVQVQCFGYGWPNGKVSTKEMVEIFNRSKINLNLSNSVQYDLKYLTSFNFTWDKKLSLIRNIYSIFGPQINTLLSPKKNEQIKARIFEISGCGGFTLTYPVKHLERYFTIPNEIETYSNINELLSKINYFLKDNKRRERIAMAGYDKTVSNHSYSNRFNKIFSQL